MVFASVKAKREAEESKLRYALENRLSKLEGYADRMEQKAGSRFRPGEDGAFVSPLMTSWSDKFPARRSPKSH
jgi:hypothetical protein